jgi:predicted lipoprotein with Yx(FWY)xxD motif
MKRIALLLLIALLALAACGSDDDGDSAGSAGAEDAAMKKDEAAMKKDEAAMKKDEAAMKKEEAAMKDAEAARAKGTIITLRDSEFGSMLFGPRRQAIYVFERDSKGESACYGECAAAWPPVFTKGKPRAGRGVRAKLLGTTRRRGGKRQVTYAGRPLYYYAHEGPGEVLCHNVDLNGGLWWVVGPNGKPRP